MRLGTHFNQYILNKITIENNKLFFVKVADLLKYFGTVKGPIEQYKMLNLKLNKNIKHDLDLQMELFVSHKALKNYKKTGFTLEKQEYRIILVLSDKFRRLG